MILRWPHVKSAHLPVCVCKPENCKVATGGQCEPRSSLTNEWNPWVILSPAECCSTLSNSQLNNHPSSSWLPEDECGFALYVFAENITFNSPLSHHTINPTGREIYAGGPGGHASLSLSFANVILLLHQNPEKTEFSDLLVLLHLELFILNGNLASCHRPPWRDDVKTSCLKCIISIQGCSLRSHRVMLLGSQFCSKLRMKEKLFAFTYDFVNILLISLTAGRLLLFNWYSWSDHHMSGAARDKMEHTKGGWLSSWNLHFGGRDRSIFINHSDECVNYKLKSAIEERKFLCTRRVQSSRSGLNWKKCPFEPKDE